MLSPFLSQAPDDVKRRPESVNHRLVFQLRAGQQEADQSGPLRLAFFLEQPVGVLRDLQQPDAVLLLAPRTDVPAVEGFLDLPIQLVQVDLIDAVLELQVLGVEPLDGPAVKRGLLLLAQA